MTRVAYCPRVHIVVYLRHGKYKEYKKVLPPHPVMVRGIYCPYCGGKVIGKPNGQFGKYLPVLSPTRAKY